MPLPRKIIAGLLVLAMQTAAPRAVMAQTTAAQNDLTVTVKGSDALQSTNSGQVSLTGAITGGSIGGTDNYVSQGAQGAATSYTQTNTAWSANGAIDSNSPVSVNGISQSGSNSGDVTINSTVSGVALNGKNASVSVSGIGTVNSISIKTTAK